MSGILGLIPARAGSVGVPGKNIRPLAGRPLICYAVEAARESGIDRVVVTTELRGYRGGRRRGRRRTAVPAAGRNWRRAPRSQPASFATRSIISWAHEGWTPDAVFYLQPTSPFRTAADIDKAHGDAGGRASANSVSSVAPVRDHPAFAWVERGGRMVRAFPDIPRPERRQDLSPMFAENNAIMLSRTSYLLQRSAARPADHQHGQFCAVSRSMIP